MAVEIFIHKMSEHMETGEIIRWLVKEGDRVEQYQIIMEVMTDKVVAELEAPAAGIVKGIRQGAEDGAVVPVGEPLGFIAALGEQVPALPPLQPVDAEGSQAAPSSPAAAPGALPDRPAAGEPGRVAATPVARRLAKELSIDLGQVKGSGPGGRIREEDVQAYADSLRPAAPVTPASSPGPVRAVPVVRRLAKELGVDLSQVPGTGPEGRIREEDVRAYVAARRPQPVLASPLAPDNGAEWLELTSIQRLTGQRMVESVHAAPHFNLTISVDATNLLWLREALLERIAAETGQRLSITAMLVKIVAAALQQHPRINASFAEGRIKLHPQVNVGVAVGTGDGLVVPVIRQAGQKSLAQVAQELKLFQDKAQALRFRQEDLADGTFTISNLGMYGIDSFNAIINPGQSAILAVGRIIKTPVGLPNDTVALRPMMSLTLSVDHRAMDGIQAARFLATLKELLEKPYFLI